MDTAQLFATEDLRAIADAPRFKYSYALGVGLVRLMRLVGEKQIQSSGRGYGSGGTSKADGAIDRWCAQLDVKFANTLERDTERPISIDGVGRFSFDGGLELPQPPPGP